MNRLHILSLLAAAMIAAAPSEAYAKPQVMTQGDTTLVVMGADTVRLVGTAIESAITSKLNDTVYNGESETLQKESSESTVASNRGDRDDEYRIAVVESKNQITKLSVFTIFSAFVLIVFIVAFFAYLQRRAKYRMMEKAIDKNYQLPAEIIGGQRPIAQQPTINLWDTPADSKAQPQPATSHFTEGTRPAGITYNWSTYKRCILTIIIGVVLVFFFLSLNSPSMAFLSSAILLYGLAKAFFTYQEQRNAAAHMPVPPQVPTQPQQPAPTQPSEPDTTTASAQTDNEQ